MSSKVRRSKEDQIITNLQVISNALTHISNCVSHEMGPFKVEKMGGPEIITDSPEVTELKKQNKLLFITLIFSVSMTLIVGIADIILRLKGF